MTRKSRRFSGDERSGFTLLELLVALGLFALISVAGFTLLSGVIGTRDRLDGRLARVAEIQRAMYLITLDFESISSTPFVTDGVSVSFQRTIDQPDGGDLSIRYFLVDEALHRQSGAADQVVLKDVEAISWRFLDEGGWTNALVSPSLADPTTGRAPRPRAVELTLQLRQRDGGLSGRLRRVVDLPREP